MIVCTPVGACGEATRIIAPALKPGCIVSDVGSVKQAVVDAMQPHIPAGVHFVPAHPVAGTENSGPEAALTELFDGRWTILTPLPGGDPAAADKLEAFGKGLGSDVQRLDPADHDRILAITSHLPHLIAYTIVGTADDLAGHLNSEVLRFAAGGFRDFTRIAASDPTMWRDVFLNNREAVLEVLQRFQEDLFYLQRAIRWGEGDKLFDLFTRTREIRRALIPTSIRREQGARDRRPAALGLRLRLVDVEPGFCRARDAGRAPAGLASRPLYLFGALSRHAEAARPHPRPAAGRRLPRPRPSPAGRALRRGAPLPDPSRDRQ